MSTPRVPWGTVHTIFVPKVAVLTGTLCVVWLVRAVGAPHLQAGLISLTIACALLPTLLAIAWPGDIPVLLVWLSFAFDIALASAAIHVGGGPNAAGAPLLYAMIIGVVSLLFSRRAAALATIACVLGYAVVIGGEALGWLPAYGAQLSVRERALTDVIMVSIYLAMIAWAASYVVGRFTAELRQREERFALAAAAAHDGIWDWHLASDTLWVSERWKRIFGLGEDDPTPTVTQWLARVHPDDAAQFLALAPRGDRTTPQLDLEYRAQHADGSYRWMMARGLILYDATRTPVRIIGAVSDIDRRKRSEAALLAQQAELEQRSAALEEAVRELERFGYSISHYLRAPLRAIDGFTYALLDEHGAHLPAQARADLARARGAVRYMGQLIDAFLSLSQLGHGDLQIAVVDLSDQARDIAAQLERAEPGRAIEWSIAPELRCSGDPALLRLVLESLLHNAWKFTRGRARAAIALELARGGAEPVYCVRDNGVGFDMAHAGKLFSPFEHVQDCADLEGLGMGLVTVQRIVQRHGGRVWAEGCVGGGATFFFSLGPRAAPGYCSSTDDQVSVTASP